MWDDQKKDYLEFYDDNICDLDPDDNFDWVEDLINEIVCDLDPNDNFDWIEDWAN